MDHIDEKLLTELRRNAKTRLAIIAKRINVPVTTVHNRVKRLEKDGIIRTYQPSLDYRKLGLGIHALIFVTAEGKQAGGKAIDQEELARAALHLPGIESAKIITGGYDLVLEARVADVEALNQLLIKELRKIPGVDKAQTMLVLEDVEKK